MNQWAGYTWLKEHFNLSVIQQLPVVSQIGRDRRTSFHDGIRHETYRPQAKPEDTPIAHLAFALKHEGVNLEILSRLFSVLDKQALNAWIESEPTGQYARKAGFLYEWLTGDRLDATPTAGNYVDILDPAEVVAATKPEKSNRWRVNNNLPGTAAFCPIVHHTALLNLSDNYDSATRLQEMEDDYGPDLMVKSAVWLTLRESRASFAIEHEGDQKSRIHRFALAMGRYSGKLDTPLAPDSLTELQRSILGTSTVRHGIRQSPVFVGSGTREMGAYIHYVAPDADKVEPMLNGLQVFLDRTQGEQPIIRAAVASFGFVFIHPLADGNGRISRFLINDTLRRDGAVPEPLLLPVSATITRSTSSRNQYDRILEAYSQPMMAATLDDIHFGQRTTYPDGVVSDFEFTGSDTLLPAWRYPDLTTQTEYLFHIVHETIEYEMRHQIQSHRAYVDARDRIKDVLDGPDEHIDRIMRSIEQNGTVSNKLRKEFPMLGDQTLADDIGAIVRDYVAQRPGRQTYDPDAEIESLLEQQEQGTSGPQPG